jgi:hypothetical protein
MSTETLVSCAETGQTGAANTSAAIKTRFIMRKIRAPLYSITTNQAAAWRTIAWLAKEIPQSEHLMKEVQSAAHFVTEAAENDGLLLFAGMGMMRAINRHHQRRTEQQRKAPKKYRLVRWMT